MDNEISAVMTATMSKIKEMVDTNTVVGEPITTPDDITLIPLSRVSFAFASGGSEFPMKENKNGVGCGSGAGVKVEPMGFLIVKDGNVRMLNVMPPASNTFDRLIDIHRGSFALDHRKRNPVDKQNDVGTCILLLVQTVTRKLLCHMKYIIFGMLPVNIFQVKALGRSVHKLLGITLAKHQSIIDLFTGTHKTVGKRLIQLGNSSLYILGGKLICNAAVSELV